MPVASTGHVRNEGDDPLTREEIRGMAQQIADADIGVFPQHGSSNVVDGDRYSQFQRLGDWADADLQSEAAADGSDLLMATAEMPDPDTVSEATGEYRQMLAILKEQAERGIGINSSIGWADDEDAPGGVDLLEVSIVGIGADPRTNTETDEAAGLVARSAVAAGADPDALIREVRKALSVAADPTIRVDVAGTEVDLSPPEAVVNACEAGLDAKNEYDLADCGTGDGEETARRIIEGDLTADYVADEIAAYLTSHADDVDGIDSPPTDWSRETWTDGCGPVQYALWGGTATGTGLQWAQSTANAVAEAKGEEIPYPEARNLDDPEFSEGDAVRWSWQGEPVHGRVADVGEQFTVSGNTITGEDGEAVYLIHEYDEDVEAFRRENAAKPQSSLSESGKDLPPASDENFQDMDSDTDAPDDGGTTDGEQRTPEDVSEDDMAEMIGEHYDGLDGADAKAALNDAGGEFLGVQVDTLSWFIGDVVDVSASEVADVLEGLMDASGKDDEGDDPEDEQGDKPMDDDEDDDEDDRDLADEVDQLRQELAEIRENGGVPPVDVDTETDPDTEQDTDEPDETREDSEDSEDTDDDTTRATGPDWRA
ncbi:hypothetical protein OSG_eHP18_00235 [environmental Halophage eHP-18]|nr:hypothetical protein OSG_eHP17_00145 [environmental Halophage eHP-17]AFH22204.1 hypothetical protein OSG_eHP18_00235 [environmental Halophage eHP-18]AFH22732.1 hypothetical protein OSG_eHP33_00145 [environmental Halophage eHP-33]